MSSPIIETPRLRIEPFRQEHLTARYVAWLNDPEVVRFSEQRHRAHTLESCREYWQSFAGTPHFFWAMVAKEASLGHIGNMNAYVDAPNGVADVGILIGERTSWGRGYGLEAWTAVCRFLLGSGLRKITAGTLATNTGMLTIMDRAGMVEDGRRALQCLWEGSPVDICHRALFADRSGRAAAGPA
ncbi:MAG TPA: GNAT family N-acetyltransferase [Burkholderiales bacterium]|nr:GNAT family N-acetyltransferase [Burkholderiales bacterium]